MYICNIELLEPKWRVKLIEIIKHFLIQYKIEGNILMIEKLNDEISDLLEFNEIFPEKV